VENTSIRARTSQIHESERVSLALPLAVAHSRAIKRDYYRGIPSN
jgi:hypothetical protein